MEKILILTHHGIKGQKWGIRRYQNPDGTLTSTGKKRLESDGKALSEASKALSKVSQIGTGNKSKTVKKDYSKMTDEALRKKVNRLNLERQYGQLTGDLKSVRSGSDWVHEVLQTTAITVGVLGSAVSIYLQLSGKGSD